MRLGALNREPTQVASSNSNSARHTLTGDTAPDHTTQTNRETKPPVFKRELKRRSADRGEGNSRGKQRAGRSLHQTSSAAKAHSPAVDADGQPRAEAPAGPNNA